MIWEGTLPQITTQNAPELLNLSSYAIIQGNSLIAISSLYYPDIQVLASKISYCESRDDPTAKNPKSTAYGLCQIIDGTWNYIQNKWDIKLDRHNPNDQMYACERLLREEGTKHWTETESCWSE